MQHSTFGERLREVRRSRGLTQAALAYQGKISGSDICKIERDRLKSSTYQINKLSAALNVSPQSLIGNDDITT